MTEYQIAAIAEIERQQSGIEDTAAWMVGEQLKELAEREPQAAELLARDLTIEEMSLAEAEKKIKAYADSHKTGNFACVTPKTAEKILREFYGLGETGIPEAPPARNVSFNLTDFM
jgi:hypothetical protein